MLAVLAAMLARWPVVLSLVLGACGIDAPSDEDAVADGGKGDRGGSGGFVEIDAHHTTAAFRAYVERAIVMLEHHPADIARLTARAIRDGKVQLDELVDLTCWDFERARRDLPDAGLSAADHAHLHDRGSAAAAALTAALDGYMWSNRIYVSRGQSTTTLASTLVHEVNHVINRSEVGYYDDLPTSAFIHEYRAFYSESLFDKTQLTGPALVDFVVTEYDLDRSKIPAAVLAQPLTPLLLPDAAAWQARRVRDDVPDIAADCPGH